MEKYDPVAEILRLQHIINSNYVIDSLRNEPKIQEYIHIAHNIRENMQSYLKPFNRQIYNIRQELDKLNAHYSAYFGKPLTYQDILFLLEQVRKEIAEQAKIEINEQEIQEIADVLQGGKSEQAISETVKTFLVWFLRVFIPILCTITGYSVKDYIALLMPTPKELICQEYHVYNAKNAEIREVNLNKGTLLVRQYPREKGKVLAELPNGERICLVNKPKGNQRWLQVRFKDDNGQIITGYVKAGLTKRLYL